jgi:transcriptional regulator with XRE-family HTH domain
MEDFAALLVAAREKLGITQAQLAVSAGLTPSYVCLLENRKKPPPSDAVCERLAAVLGVPPGDLLEVAHLQRSPETVQRRVRALSGRLSREQRSRHRLLESLLSPFLVATPTKWIEDAFEWIGGGAARRRRLREVLQALGRRHQDRATAVSRLVDELPERDRRLLLEALPRILGEQDRRDTRAATPSPDLFYVLPPPDEAPQRPFLLAWSEEGAAVGELRDGDLLLVDPGQTPRAGDLVVSRRSDGAAAVRRLPPSGDAVGPAPGEGGMPRLPARGEAWVVVEIRRPMRRRSR